MIVVIQWLLIIVALVLGAVALSMTTNATTTTTQEMKTVQEEVFESMKGRIIETGQAIIPGTNVGTGSGDRSDVKEVVFTKIYKEPPRIILSVAQIDAATSNIRYVVVPEEVTTTGFKIRVKTWGNSQMWTTIVQWATVT